MSEGNPLDRPATEEDLAEIERLLKPTAEIVPLRRAPKVSTDSPTDPERGPEAVVLPFLEPTGAVWLARGDQRPPGWVREGDRPVRPSRPSKSDHGWVWGISDDDE